MVKKVNHATMFYYSFRFSMLPYVKTVKENGDVRIYIILFTILSLGLTETVKNLCKMCLTSFAWVFLVTIYSLKPVVCIVAK